MMSEDRQGIMIIVAVVVVVVGIAFFAQWRLKSSQIDEATLCLITGSKQHTAVVIDKSDKWKDSDARRIEALLLKINSQVAVNSRLTIWSISNNGSKVTELRNEFDKCNPGSVEDCNAVYQNCRRVKKRYDSSFKAGLIKVVKTLTSPTVSSHSPLFETIIEVIRSYPNQSITIHLVSDLIENGEQFNFYKGIPPVESLISEYPISANTYVKVILHGIKRQKHSLRFNKAIQNVWEEYFEKQNVDSNYQRLLITK